MGARFEVFQDRSGEWRYTLVSANGEPVAQSEGYTTKADAERGAQAAKVAAEDAEVES